VSDPTDGTAESDVAVPDERSAGQDAAVSGGAPGAPAIETADSGLNDEAGGVDAVAGALSPGSTATSAPTGPADVADSSADGATSPADPE